MTFLSAWDQIFLTDPIIEPSSTYFQIYTSNLYIIFQEINQFAETWDNDIHRSVGNYGNGNINFFNSPSPSSPIRQSEKSSSVKRWPCCKIFAKTLQFSAEMQLPTRLRVVEPILQASNTPDIGSKPRFLHDFKYLL